MPRGDAEVLDLEFEGNAEHDQAEHDVERAERPRIEIQMHLIDGCHASSSDFVAGCAERASLL